MRPIVVCILTTVSLLFIARAQAQAPFEEAFPDLPAFDRPVDIQALPGTDRLAVVEQGGVITSFENVATVNRPDTLLDIQDVVMDIVPSWEEGLLGLAFHPSYAENGHLFVHYTTFPETEGGPHRTIIARFTVPDPSAEIPLADRDSEVVLLDIEQPYRWHNGGQLAFHPDGTLFLSLGDGGSAGDPGEHAQNRETLLGSILRLDVDNPDEGLNYGIPSDNPFVGNTEGWRPEIWAYGLRNPWRFSIDPETGWLWVGDVGQNRWEEVTVLTRPGENLGWDVMEAAFCFDEPPDPGEPSCGSPTLTDPIWWYRHEDGNNSISGGHVYRGTFASGLVGQYIYGDFISGRVWALDYEGLDEPVNQEIDQLQNVSAFGTDKNGELYLASFNGSLYRLARGVAGEPAAPGGTFALRPAFPNPFASATTLEFGLAEAGPVRLAVYDVLGREVAVLLDGVAPAGEQTVRFDAEGLAPGVYVVRMVADGRTAAQTLTLVR